MVQVLRESEPQKSRAYIKELARNRLLMGSVFTTLERLPGALPNDEKLEHVVPTPSKKAPIRELLCKAKKLSPPDVAGTRYAYTILLQMLLQQQEQPRQKEQHQHLKQIETTAVPAGAGVGLEREGEEQGDVDASADADTDADEEADTEAEVETEETEAESDNRQ